MQQWCKSNSSVTVLWIITQLSPLHIMYKHLWVNSLYKSEKMECISGINCDFFVSRENEVTVSDFLCRKQWCWCHCQHYVCCNACGLDNGELAWQVKCPRPFFRVFPWGSEKSKIGGDPMCKFFQDLGLCQFLGVGGLWIFFFFFDFCKFFFHNKFWTTHICSRNEKVSWAIWGLGFMEGGLSQHFWISKKFFFHICKLFHKTFEQHKFVPEAKKPP